MRGKERDIKLAETIRNEFMTLYSDDAKFAELIDQLGDTTVDRLIHRLNHEKRIDLYKDYKALKTMGENIVDTCKGEVFKEACHTEDARVWINNKGKYQDLVFESLYTVFYQYGPLQEYIKE